MGFIYRSLFDFYIIYPINLKISTVKHIAILCNMSMIKCRRAMFFIYKNTVMYISYLKRILLSECFPVASLDAALGSVNCNLV